jgi:hypothetical protein
MIKLRQLRGEWEEEFSIARLAGDLLGFELAVEGLEDPVLEDFAVARLYFAEDETQAGWPGVEDHRFGLEGFFGFANFHIHVALLLKGRSGFEETALQAQLGHPRGETRFRRGFRSDFGIRVEGKAQATVFSAHFSSLCHPKLQVEAVEGRETRIG